MGLFKSIFNYIFKEKDSEEETSSEKEIVKNNENENTLLIQAILNKNIDVVNQLLESNINIFEKNLYGDTALSISLTKLYHGKDEDYDYYKQICIKLINLCDENIWEEYFYEAEHALIYASENNKIDVVKKLIDAGMFLDFQNDMGRTALIQSLIKKNKDIAKLLIKAGAKTDIQSDSSYKFSAIGWATSLGYEDVIDELIKVGTNLDIVGSSEENHHTPLLEAIVRKHSNIAIKLIEAGANVNIYAYSNIYSEENFDEQGNYAKKYTPLLIASSDGNLNIVKKLIEFGGNVNFQNSSGYTALMFASLQKRTDIVKLLIDTGADMTLKNKEGKTALDLTLENSKTINS